jgi:U3 small nucleolar RNA-associated protein 11
MKMDVVKLLKTQDVGYLQTIVQQTRLAREKAEKRLVLLRVGAGVGVEGGVLGKGTRMMFDEDGELVVDKKKKSQVALDDDDHHDDEEMDMDMDMDNMDLDDLDDLTDLYDGESEQNDGKSADKVKNGKSTDDGKSEDKVKNGKSTNDTTNLSKEEIRQRRKKVRAQEVLQKYLQALTEREHDLTAALTQLQEQRARMSNSVGGVNKEGVKFKVRERKR